MKKANLSLLLILFNSILFAQNPTLVADIHPGSDASFSSYPDHLVTYNGKAYYSAESDIEGIELWCSDGTEEGTYLVKDINPGAEGSYPQGLYVYNGIVFFSASDGVHGYELWRSDGTEEGTYLVKDLEPGSGHSYPTGFIFFNKLFFQAQTSTQGTELWYSDGTEQNTHVIDINLGAQSSNPKDFTISGSYLYFSANNGTHGTELWKTDGSVANTAMVEDLYPGTTSSLSWSESNYFCDMDGVLLFKAFGSGYGYELWRSTGTASGTYMVRDIRSGTSSSLPKFLTNVDGTVYFSCIDGTNGYELWKTDGSYGGTVLVEDIRAGSSNSSPEGLVNGNGTLYFICDDGTGDDLWRSQGDAANTYKVKDLTGFVNTYSMSYSNNYVFFEVGYDMWRSNGTSGGTVEVKSGCKSIYSGFHTLNGTHTVFSAELTGEGKELWITDGLEANTQVVKQGASNNGSLDDYSTLINYNEFVYFEGYNGDTDVGDELWMSDGSKINTELVGDFYPGTNNSLYPTDFNVIGDILYFRGKTGPVNSGIFSFTHGEEKPDLIYDINGSISLKGSFKENLIFVSGIDSLYAYNAKSSEFIFLGNKSSMSDFTKANIGIYFTCANAGRIDLWITDGTVDGTSLVKSGFYPDGAMPYTSAPYNFVAVGSNLFFMGSTGSDSYLWRSNGTTDGTTIFGAGDISAQFIGTDGYNLYFSDYKNGKKELCFKSGNTFYNDDYNILDKFDSQIAFLSGASYQGEYYFVVLKQYNEYQQLWKTDGTAEGTVLVAPINTLIIQGNYPKGFIDYNGILYFSAMANGQGRRLWRTDGTEDGTYTISDVNCISDSKNKFAKANDLLFFIGDDGEKGKELWKFECLIDITNQSDSKNLCLNETTSIHVVANSTKEPISYQWQYYKDGWMNLSDNDFFSGTSNDTLTMVSLLKSQSGNYRCIVSGECGFDTSSIISVSVNELPEISIVGVQDSKAVCPEKDITLSAKGGQNYQWSGNGVTELSGQTTIVNLSGTDSSTIVLEGEDAIGCIGLDSVVLTPLLPYNQKINAMVTVDPYSGKNMVVWNKPYKEGIYSFNVSKGLETSPTLLENVRFQDFNRFIDVGSTPKQNYEDYYITISDTCGTTTDILEHHRPIHLQVNINTVAIPNEVNLSWNEYIGFEYDSFYVYRGTDSTDLEFVRGIPHNAPPFTYSEELEGHKIYYKVVVNAPQTIFLEGNKKANSGPFSRSVSNLEDNRQQATNLQMQASSRKLQVYPNPMTESCTINFPNPNNKAYTLYISDITGKVLLMEENITTSKYRFNRQNLNAGLYIIELRGENTYRGQIIAE